MVSERLPIQAIDRFITEQMDLGRTPGLALTVSRDGEVVYERGYGYADLATQRPMTERTGVVIGSTTKALTCAAIVQLADKGLLDLDDPIKRHVPAFRVADDEATERMTIRQALTHTAGLPPSSAFNPRFLFSDDDADDALERYVAELASTQLIEPPGGSWVYANDGFVLTGRIVEIISGMSYEEYMRRNVFGPLCLEDAAFHGDEKPGLQVATPYDFDADGRPYPSFFPHNRSAAAAGSQLILTARDAGRWLRVMLDEGRIDGGRLVSEQGYAELVRPQARIPGAEVGRDANGPDAWYGLGWIVGPLGDVPTISHGGAAITMGSQFILVPRERLAVAVLANSVSEVTGAVAEGVMNLALGHRPGRSFARVDRSIRPDRALWPRLAGTYHAQTRQNKVMGPWPIQLDGDRLYVRTYPGDSRRRPGDIFLFPLGETRFVLFGRGRTGGLVSFEIAGDAVRATWEGVPIVKASQ